MILGNDSIIVPFDGTIVGVGISASNDMADGGGLTVVSLNPSTISGSTVDGSAIAAVVNGSATAEGSNVTLFIPCSIPVRKGQIVYSHAPVDRTIVNVCLQGNP